MRRPAMAPLRQTCTPIRQARVPFKRIWDFIVVIGHPVRRQENGAVVSPRRLLRNDNALPVAPIAQAVQPGNLESRSDSVVALDEVRQIPLYYKRKTTRSWSLHPVQTETHSDRKFSRCCIAQGTPRAHPPWERRYVICHRVAGRRATNAVQPGIRKADGTAWQIMKSRRDVLHELAK